MVLLFEHLFVMIELSTSFEPYSNWIFAKLYDFILWFFVISLACFELAFVFAALVFILLTLVAWWAQCIKKFMEQNVVVNCSFVFIRKLIFIAIILTVVMLVFVAELVFVTGLILVLIVFTIRFILAVKLIFVDIFATVLILATLIIE